jgi:hypothetical protein
VASVGLHRADVQGCALWHVRTPRGHTRAIGVPVASDRVHRPPVPPPPNPLSPTPTKQYAYLRSRQSLRFTFTLLQSNVVSIPGSYFGRFWFKSWSEDFNCFPKPIPKKYWDSILNGYKGFFWHPFQLSYHHISQVLVEASLNALRINHISPHVRSFRKAKITVACSRRYYQLQVTRKLHVAVPH